MNKIDIYLDLVQEEELHEGKIWDKVKKVWKDHKGKIMVGAGAIAAGAAAYGGKKTYDKNKAEKSSATKKANVDKFKAADNQSMKVYNKQKETKTINSMKKRGYTDQKTKDVASGNTARQRLIKKNVAYADLKDKGDEASDAMKKSVDSGAKEEIYNKYHPTGVGKKVGRFFRNAKLAREKLAKQNKSSKNRGTLNKLFSKTGA